MVAQLGIGLFLAALFVGITRAVARSREATVYGIGLVVASLAYVVFSVTARSIPWILIESVGVVFFGVFAFLGVRGAPLFLALGWALHAAWDLSLHALITTSFVPVWYPTACLAFDVLLAAYVGIAIAAAPSRAEPAEPRGR